MITIKDIAREANVTPTTVSNVINGNHSKVSEKTIHKVKAIIKKYNYTPNMNARSLVSNTSRIIGVIIPQPGEDKIKFLRNPFNAEILSGIEQMIKENNYYLMVRSVKGYSEITELLKNWAVDGIIILGLSQDESLKLLSSSDIPVVFIDSYINNDSVMNVGLQDELGGFLATSYLIEKGHRNIGFVTYEFKEYSVIDERLKGYEKALKEHSIPFEEQNILKVALPITPSEETQKQLFDISQRVTALFFTADLLAVEAMHFLQECGIKVPENLSIVGFDDLYISSLVTPKLTTINQDIFKKGALAAELLINSIENKPISEHKVLLSVSLVERQSVAALHSKNS